jgi:hypothetical protein
MKTRPARNGHPSDLKAIAAALNERVIPTAAGHGQWQPAEVSRVLARMPA